LKLLALKTEFLRDAKRAFPTASLKTKRLAELSLDQPFCLTPQAED
jgi:hypothetical protein